MVVGGEVLWESNSEEKASLARIKPFFPARPGRGACAVCTLTYDSRDEGVLGNRLILLIVGVRKRGGRIILLKGSEYFKK